MAGFLKNLGGDNDLAKLAGQKVGSVVEEGVKSVIAGKKGPQNQEKKGGGGAGAGAGGGGGGGFGVGDALSLVTGSKDHNKGGGGGGGGGGFGVGDALSFVTGKKDQNKGGSGSADAPAPQAERKDGDTGDFSLEAGLDAN